MPYEAPAVPAAPGVVAPSPITPQAAPAPAPVAVPPPAPAVTKEPAPRCRGPGRRRWGGGRTDVPVCPFSRSAAGSAAPRFKARSCHQQASSRFNLKIAHTYLKTGRRVASVWYLMFIPQSASAFGA